MADYGLGAEGAPEHIRNALAVLQGFYDTAVRDMAAYHATSAHDARRKLLLFNSELNSVLQAIRGRLVKALACLEADRGHS